MDSFQHEQDVASVFFEAIQKQGYNVSNIASLLDQRQSRKTLRTHSNDLIRHADPFAILVANWLWTGARLPEASPVAGHDITDKPYK